MASSIHWLRKVACGSVGGLFPNRVVQMQLQEIGRSLSLIREKQIYERQMLAAAPFCLVPVNGFAVLHQSA